MREWVLAIGLAGITAAAMADAVIEPPTPSPGIYSNEEQVYFAKEAGKTPVPPLVFLIVDDKLGVTIVDAFGRPDNRNGNGIAIVAADDQRLNARLADNSFLDLRRARPATCWIAIRKDKPKPDGKEDWFFQRDVKLHDQGGRALVGGDKSGAQPLVLRMRNVIWPPPSSNKPSVVLYIHKPDQPDRAESYAWADPGAARIGINLRWMQASCTIDGAEKASEVNSTTFRG